MKREPTIAIRPDIYELLKAEAKKDKRSVKVYLELLLEEALNRDTIAGGKASSLPLAMGA